MLYTFRIQTGVKLLIFLSITCRACTGLRCYMGVSHKNTVTGDNADELQQVQCSRKYQHEQQYIRHNGDFAETSAINVSYSLQSADNEDNASEEITNCAIFYNTATDVADFACDHDNICADATSTKQTSMCHKGIRGTLFCCQGDLCNMDSYMRRLSPPQAATVCYNGTNDGKFNLNEIQCRTSWCYQSATFMANGRLIEQKFGCEDKCAEEEFELNGALCREHFLHGGMRQRVCYCSVDRCNSIVHPIMSGSADTEPGRFPHTVPPYLRMQNPESDYDHYGHISKRWAFMAGWIGASVLGLLFISLVGLLVHRCRQQRAKKTLFSYSQLNSEATDQESLKQEKAVTA